MVRKRERSSRLFSIDILSSMFDFCVYVCVCLPPSCPVYSLCTLFRTFHQQSWIEFEGEEEEDVRLLYDNQTSRKVFPEMLSLDRNVPWFESLDRFKRNKYTSRLTWSEQFYWTHKVRWNNSSFPSSNLFQTFLSHAPFHLHFYRISLRFQIALFFLIEEGFISWFPFSRLPWTVHWTLCLSPVSPGSSPNPSQDCKTRKLTWAHIFSYTISILRTVQRLV